MCTHKLCFEQKYENSQTVSTENCHFYSREISLYIAWACFRNDLIEPLHRRDKITDQNLFHAWEDARQNHTICCSCEVCSKDPVGMFIRITYPCDLYPLAPHFYIAW